MNKICVFVLRKEEKMRADDPMHMQKISNDTMNHCQVEDADDPSTDMSSCCSMKPFYAAVLWLQLAEVPKSLFLKIKAFPTINLKAS